MKEEIEKIIIEAQLGNIGSWKAAQQVLDLFAVSNNEALESSSVGVAVCTAPKNSYPCQSHGITDGCYDCPFKKVQTDC